MAEACMNWPFDYQKTMPNMMKDVKLLRALRVRRFSVVKLILLLALVDNPLIFTPTLAGDAAQTINSSKDVLKNWSPTQNLYVVGNIRLSQSSLDALEKWLDENGKNWTIVLMQRANGES